MTTHDVLVVGAGPAGTAVAYQLRDSGLDVVLLEATGEVGGRTRSVVLPGGRANTGALFVYRGTPSEHLATELDLPTVPFRPETYGIAMDGVTAVGADPATVVAGLPLGADDADALLTALQDAIADYRVYTSGGSLGSESSSLAEQTVADRLRALPDGARTVLETAVRGGSVGRPEDLNAQYALRYFASYPALEQNNRLLLVGGMQALSTGMAERLPVGTLRVATRVHEVQQEDDGTYAVTAEGPDGADVFLARQVVLAVPAPLVPGLLPELPAEKRAALATARTPGSTTMVVAADVSGLEEHRDWAFVTTVGSAFDCIINPVPGPQSFRPQPPGQEIVHYVCYGNSAGYRPDLATDLAEHSSARDAWIEDFLTVAPRLRGRIRGVHVQTWEHCFAVLSPERAKAVEELRRAVGGVHFAGDWTSETAGTHGALTEAHRVVEAVLATSATTGSSAK